MTAHTRQYTGTCDSQAEALLQTALTELARQLSAAAPEGLLGVYLGGGYGRGEGGVLYDADGSARLYNDLDFFVLVQDGVSAQTTQDISRHLRQLAKPLEERLGIDIDFSPPKQLCQLQSVAPRLMFQEFRRGHVPLFGPAELPEQAIPALEAAELPVTEALRLLLNRGMGLLLAGEVLLRQDASQAGFILRNLNKTVLGCGDAWLIARHAYDWTLSQRQQRLQEGTLDNQPRGLAERYRQAVDFKLRPHARLPEAPLALWQELRRLWLDTLYAVLQLPPDAARPAQLRRALHLLCRQSGAYGLRQTLRWFRRTFTFPPWPLWGDDPVASVLAELAEVVLRADSPTDIPRKLRCHWQHFN